MTYNGKSKIIQALVYAINNLPVMKGADGSTAGEKGLVPAPAAEDNEKFLRGDGKWVRVMSGGGGSFYKEIIYDAASSADGTLSQSINDYDLLAIETYYMYSGRKIISTEWIIVSDMVMDETKAWYQCGVLNDVTITFSDKTFVKHTGSQLVNRIWGVKIGG